MKLIYATTNPGKFEEVQKLFSSHHLPLHSPQEFGVSLTIAETGSTLEENACLKAETYLHALPSDCVVLGDDTGVEIDALGGEPGIRVRRWIGKEMSDQEIIDYCIKRMNKVPLKKRQAQFRTVIAVAALNKQTHTFSGVLSGHIVKTPTPLKIKGFPFESLFFADEYRLMLGDIHQLTIEEKISKSILTHRERAINAALPHLLALSQSN